MTTHSLTRMSFNEGLYRARETMWFYAEKWMEDQMTKKDREIEEAWHLENPLTELCIRCGVNEIKALDICDECLYKEEMVY